MENTSGVPGAAKRAQCRYLLDLSPRRVGLWGAAAGVAAGALPFFIGDPAGSISVPVLAAVVMTTTGSLSTLSAVGSLLLAQRAERRALKRLEQQLLAANF